MDAGESAGQQAERYPDGKADLLCGAMSDPGHGGRYNLRGPGRIRIRQKAATERSVNSRLIHERADSVPVRVAR